MKINITDSELLTKILQRKIRADSEEHEVDLGEVLREILSWANEFVPSEAGSILIDDPVLKMEKRSNGKLYFVACFGKGSERLVGTSVDDGVGIIGETYNSGKPYHCKDVTKDEKFFSVHEITHYECRSIICVPIYIDSAIVGVLELINRNDKETYNAKDLSLLEIFAGYTGTFIQNALDARRFEEMSKRDNLTGLYNDRYFLQRIAYEVGRVKKWGGDVALVFFDLDSLKEVNDTHGHLVGSRVLKEIADITGQVFAGTDAVLTRYGGDEYIVILPDKNNAAAKDYAERLRKRVEENVFINTSISPGMPPLNIQGLVTCSLGVASLSENVIPKDNAGAMVESLIRASDSAMYEAKGHGKNRVVQYKGKMG